MNYVTGIVQIRQCLGQLENKKNTGRGSRCLSGKQLPASRAATHLEKAILQLHVQESVFLGVGRSLGQGVRRRLSLGRRGSARRRRHIGGVVGLRLLHSKNKLLKISKDFIDCYLKRNMHGSRY